MFFIKFGQAIYQKLHVLVMLGNVTDRVYGTVHVCTGCGGQHRDNENYLYRLSGFISRI